MRPTYRPTVTSFRDSVVWNRQNNSSSQDITISWPQSCLEGGFIRKKTWTMVKEPSQYSRPKRLRTTIVLRCCRPTHRNRVQNKLIGKHIFKIKLHLMCLRLLNEGMWKSGGVTPLLLKFDAAWMWRRCLKPPKFYLRPRIPDTSCVGLRVGVVPLNRCLWTRPAIEPQFLCCQNLWLVSVLTELSWPSESATFGSL